MPRKKLTPEENKQTVADLKTELTVVRNILEAVTKERGKMQSELLDTVGKLRQTERELRATKQAMILMSETLIERPQGTWTAQIFYEPRVAKGD